MGPRRSAVAVRPRLLYLAAVLFALACAALWPPALIHAQRTSDIPTGIAHRPFSAIAIEAHASTLGFGGDVATPLASRMNLRLGVNLLNAHIDTTASGMNVTGYARFRSGTASLDLFPFRGGFHISPGVTYRHTYSTYANLAIPAGGSFTLDDQPYTSSATDPVSGRIALVLGPHSVVPQLTVGWGNMIPRSGRHFSVPVDLGVQYIGQPTATLNLQGSACQQLTDEGHTASVCQPLATNAEAQSDIQAETSRLNNRISPYRVYPVVSIGLAYRF